MRIARPHALELDYTRDMMFPLLLRPASWPRSVLQVGLGAASLTRFLHRHRPRAAQTIIELDPAVIGVAQQAFKLPAEGPRLRIEINDGFDYLVATDRTFDLILVDGFDAQGRAGALDTLPFYCNVEAHLADDGFAVVNLLSRNRGARASIERMRAAFRDRVLALPTCASGNVVALAMRGDPARIGAPALRAAATALKRATGLDLATTVKRLAGGRAEIPI
ncbi:MAG: fused MFS/spermidine synthase [Proteobacteria bacterium]|nr:fused MFS/spermidine synthase [Pseudomonadota bacterium]